MSQEVSVLAGLHINELLSVGYAYDTGTGDFARYTHGSYEVVLNIQLSNCQKSSVRSICGKPARE